MHPMPSRRRAGFTLIELLIVIAIIAILLSLSAAATVRVIDVQRGNNTEQTVKILSEVLDRHWQAVVDQAKNETIPSQVQAMAQDARTARVIWIKLRLRREFPMTFDEARRPVIAGIPQLATVPAYVNGLAGMTSARPEVESSVCLLLALQQNRSGMTFDPDRLGSGAITAAPGGSQSVKMVVDGFANPIAFFRWPVDNRELNPDPQGHLGHKDPTDPEGLLTARSWVEVDAYRNAFTDPRLGLHRVPRNPASGGTARSYHLIPVVSSAGRNGQFGIDMTTMAPGGNPELYNDNVDSYRLRFGARGD